MIKQKLKFYFYKKMDMLSFEASNGWLEGFLARNKSKKSNHDLF